MSSRSTFHGAAVLALLAFVTLPPAEAEAQLVDEAMYDALRWNNIGPARGGRATGVAGSDARPFEYYFGASGGGLWKTEDGGLNWSNVTDGHIGSGSVNAIGVCEADPDIVYIGTGETQIRGNIMQGDGAYRSDNAGRTWDHVGLTETQNISRIRVHPTDCNTAWAATFGKHSVDNPERGVYKTTDGGQSWEQVLYRDEKTGAVDISVHPGNPDIVYAAMWEAWRKSWGMSSGGPGSGLFRSLDGGETWTEISRNPGLPQEGVIGKIGVAVSPVDSDRVYAIVEHAEGGVFVSDDGGETWEHTNDERRLRQRAFYYTRIYADPQERDVAYVLNTGFYQSRDGGKTFPRAYRVPHGDNHDLWIAPSNNQRMANSNDGGGNVSVNGGQTWTDQDFSTAQFYRVITTNHEPYHICGAQQDNSTACIPSGGWNHLSNDAGGPNYLYSAGGCESGYIAPHPEDTDIFYAGCYGGSLSRYDHGTGLSRSINVWPENPMGQSAEDLVERVQWTFPIVFSPHDPNLLFTGTQKVWKTTNEGQTWVQISPDITRADPMTIGPSGGPVTLDQTGVETYATVFAIAPSPHDADVIWAGSDDGYVHITRNATADQPSWTNVTPPDAPDFVRINTIEASPHTPGKAYVSGIRYLVEDDRAPYVWITEDYGQNWTKAVNGIEADHFVRAVREDPVRPEMLYAATEETVYISWNDGGDWQPLTLNLPNTQYSDLVVEDHDIVVGTHGRSFWVLNDMLPLRQITAEMMDADAVLFDPVDPVRRFDNSVQLFYYLADDAESVQFEFIAPNGEVVQTFASQPPGEQEEARGGGGFGGFRGARPSTRAGSNRFSWNMRYPGYTDFEGRIFWAAGNQGPAAVPGVYTARMTVDGETYEQDFEIKMNPRAVAEGVTMADLQARFDFAMQINARVSEANEAVIRIRRIKEQIEARQAESDNAELAELGTQVDGKLGAVEGEIYQVRNQSNQDPLNFPIKLNNKIAALLGGVEGAESRPTDQSFDVFEKLNVELDAQLELLTIIIQQDVQQLNELLRSLGLNPIETENLIT